jgi:hypothetical protein
MPHHGGRFVGLQEEPGDHPGKAGAGAAGRPQQVRVLPGIGVDQFPVCGHDVQPGHALAGPSLRAAVPALAALQQETAHAHAHGLAVATGERPAPLGQVGRELLASLDGRPDGDHPRRRIVRHVAHAAQVGQQRAVAQAPRRPRVAAGAHAHRPLSFGRQPDALDHVRVALGEEHRRGEPVRAARLKMRPVRACSYHGSPRRIRRPASRSGTEAVIRPPPRRRRRECWPR